MSVKKGSPIVDLYAWQLSREIHKGNISAYEVMEAFLDRIDEVNPKVNAIVALRERDELLKEAKAKDGSLSKASGGGWMHGFPQAIKDLEDTKGIKSTNGYLGDAERIPDNDSLLVSNIKKAGAIIIGKTNSPEWGFGSQTYNEVYGATGNPYNPELTAGGSSGGAACAAALNMQAVVDGSDFMGSLRNPAGYCNIFGFRPSWGRVPSLSPDLFYQNCGVKGPMGRTVPDLALLLSTLSGYNPKIPASLEDDVNLKSLTPDNVCEKLQGDVRGLKIAWMGDLDGYLPMEEGVLKVCEEALKKLSKDAGVVVEHVKPFFNPAEFWEKVWLPIRHFAAAALKPLYDDPNKRKLLKPEAVFEYESSLKYSASDLYKAGVLRSELYAATMKIFENYDFIASPTAQVFPFNKTTHWPKEIAGKKMDAYFRWMEVVSHWTMTGCPVAAVPAGFSEDNRPMGLQIAGKPRSDFKLLQFVYGYEKVHEEIINRRSTF
ncbi:MAG: amidase [Defluviitaleaceae bacterium]|nr:amidase [Defluviitaleaceae bacterium]